MTANGGVRGFYDWRFWLVLSLYGIACLLFFESGMTRDGWYVVFPAVMAYITMTTIAWEHRIIGDPSRPHALILHAAFGIALYFFFCRVIFSFGDNVSNLFDAVTGTAIPATLRHFGPVGGVISLVEGVSGFVFTTLASVILFFILTLVLVMRRRWALPLLAMLLLLLSLFTVRLGLWPSIGMFGGMILSYVAFRVQIEDDVQSRFWNAVFGRADRDKPRPRVVTELKIDLLERLFRTPRLYENGIRGALSHRLGCVPSDPKVTAVATFFIEELSDRDDLVTKGEDIRGPYIALRAESETDGIFARMALIPKAVVVFVAATLYILSPIDAIPDNIPVFGVLDDLLIGIVGYTCSVMSFLGIKRILPRRDPAVPPERGRP